MMEISNILKMSPSSTPCISRERMMGFLEKNGGNLEILSISNMDSLQSSDTIISCPKLKLLNILVIVV